MESHQTVGTLVDSVSDLTFRLIVRIYEVTLGTDDTCQCKRIGFSFFQRYGKRLLNGKRLFPREKTNAAISHRSSYVISMNI